MSLILEAALPLVLLVYYLAAYFKVRRKPEYQPVVVQFEPAEGLSPAAARFVWAGRVDQRTVACVFAQLAVKGFIRIESESGLYHITRTKPSGPLPAVTREEQIALDWLFSNFLTEKEFRPMHDSQGCIAALGGSLQKQAGGLYHNTHYGFVAAGMLGSLIAAFAMASTVTTSDRGGIYVLTWIVFMAVLLAVVTIWATLISSIADLVRGVGDYSRPLFGIVASAFVVASVAAVTDKLQHLSSTVFVTSVLVVSAMNGIAGFFLKSETPRGVQVRQQLEGFREFLRTAEQDRLDRLHPSGKEFQSRERNLAYAIALDVKEAWGDDLANACYLQLA